ncbi:MAG: hypothetical protein NTW21_01435 [Verrucomicrobia bacterium]|nr:hypothetical protein [Verrucomicrobiota bacterium]
MKAVIGDDALDAAGADGVAELPELPGDDRGADRRIEEAEADGQPDDLVGAAVVGFGPTGFRGQGGGTRTQIERAQLVLALAAEIELAGRLGRAETPALAGQQHGQAA